LYIWQTLNYVQLTWEEQSDATGYHIYRRTQRETWERLTSEPLPISAFIDHPSSGVSSIRYQVTFLDQQGNEHGLTSIADIMFQPLAPQVQSATQFERNNIIPDAEYLSETSVTVSQVQAFLEEKNSFLAGYRLPDDRLASRAIVEESLQNEINPVQILARLQMEQGLISITTRPAQHRLDYALGYGCPDTAACSQEYKGFDRQIVAATRNLRAYIREIDEHGETRSGWAPGRRKQTLDPLTVTPANRATAALYTYTPWVGQGGGGRSGVGGNYLFWSLYYNYIQSFNTSPPNQRPHAPRPVAPANGKLTTSRTVTLEWQDQGDPDSGPRSYRDFFAEIWKSDNSWKKQRNWSTETNWRVTVPSDGVYHWRVRSGDGEDASTWSNTWRFSVDTTAPTNPTTANSDGSRNGVWQNRVRQPTFTWSEAQDNLSGVQEYLIYWGTNPSGTSNQAQTRTHFTAPSPVANVESVATYYLRIAIRDKAGNTSTWHTLSTFRYDGSSPAGRATLNHGWGSASSVSIPVSLAAHDTGSGVHQVRLSNDSTHWSEWRPMAGNIWWMVVGQHGSTADVDVQYRDQAGNMSSVIKQSLTLNFYPEQPHSSQYRLSSDVMAMTGGNRTSSRYQLGNTGGEVLSSGTYGSGLNYEAATGYWARVASGDTFTPDTSSTIFKSNFMTGSPGSTFIFTATNFPAAAEATISIKEPDAGDYRDIARLPLSAEGDVVFVLYIPQDAQEGMYTVRITVQGVATMLVEHLVKDVTLTIEDGQPHRNNNPAEPIPVISPDTGLVTRTQVYLPLVVR
jgi:hypothetical protein